MFQVKPISFDEARKLAGAAARERSMITQPPESIWIGAFHGPMLVACGGLAILRGSHARFRGLFVSPPYRGKGLSTRIQDARMDLARDLNCSSASAYATTERSVKWFLKNGFELINESRGIAFVRRTL